MGYGWEILHYFQNDVGMRHPEQHEGSFVIKQLRFPKFRVFVVKN